MGLEPNGCRPLISRNFEPTELRVPLALTAPYRPESIDNDSDIRFSIATFNYLAVALPRQRLHVELRPKGPMKNQALPWRAALVAIVLFTLCSLGLTASSALAGDGPYCGTYENPTHLDSYRHCTGNVLRNFRAIVANTHTGTRNACAALSTTPGTLTLGSYSCTGGTYFSAWNCPSAPCYGYASIWKSGPGAGEYYGWYIWV